MNPVRTNRIELTRDLSLGSGNVSYTGMGFKPSAIIITGCVLSGYQGFWGFPDLGIQEGKDNTNHLVQAVSAVMFFTPSSNAYQYATLVSYDANGFTLAWVKVNSPTGTAYCWVTGIV